MSKKIIQTAKIIEPDKTDKTVSSKKHKIVLKPWQRIALPLGAAAVIIGGGLGLGFALKNSEAADTADYSVDTGVKKSTLSDDGETITIKDGENLISKAGTYTITGNTENGYIHINAGEDDEVKIVLQNASIKNPNGPAIYVESNGNTYIVLEGENTIDAAPTDDLNGTIFSKADLSFEGDGSLSINSTLDGIVGKDDLEISGGTYDITAEDDGIVGKDSLKITGGTFKVKTGGLGLKTSNEEGKGDLEITGGTFDIDSTGKGIKAEGSLVISGGDITVISEDDSVHSNGFIHITSGKLALSSGDDGIHANATLTVDGGEITITKSYEGLEANIVNLNSGTIDITSEDDGINSTNSDGNNEMFTSGDAELNIKGGSISINAGGDGLDSNGSISIAGGTIYVDGPTNSGNAAVDCDGSIKITGGTLIALGMSGMSQNATEAAQPSVLINLTSTYQAGSAIEFGSIAYTSKKSFNSILISSPDLSTGQSYDLKINGKIIQSVTISDNITGEGSGMMGGRGGRPGQDDQNGQNGQDDQPGQGGQSGGRPGMRGR